MQKFHDRITPRIQTSLPQSFLKDLSYPGTTLTLSKIISPPTEASQIQTCNLFCKWTLISPQLLCAAGVKVPALYPSKSQPRAPKTRAAQNRPRRGTYRIPQAYQPEHSTKAEPMVPLSCAPRPIFDLYGYEYGSDGARPEGWKVLKVPEKAMLTEI